MSWKKLLPTSLVAAGIALVGLAWLMPSKADAQGGGGAGSCGAGAGQMCRKVCDEPCEYICCDERYFYYALDA